MNEESPPPPMLNEESPPPPMLPNRSAVSAGWPNIAPQDCRDRIVTATVLKYLLSTIIAAINPSRAITTTTQPTPIFVSKNGCEGKTTDPMTFAGRSYFQKRLIVVLRTFPR